MKVKLAEWFASLALTSREFLLTPPMLYVLRVCRVVDKAGLLAQKPGPNSDGDSGAAPAPAFAAEVSW